jgi:ankyrin repeat protein
MSNHKFHNLLKSQRVFLALALGVLSQAAENSPFYLPIRNNDRSTLSKLVRVSGSNARDAHGNSPLLYAAALGSLDSMGLLLDRNAR